MVSSVANLQNLKKVLNLSDTITNTKARLDLMNDGMQTTDELQKKIMDSANRSRSSYQATANAVTQMGTMAGDKFSSNDELNFNLQNCLINSLLFRAQAPKAWIPL